ncbi:hypothetical protein, partial [Ferdinandcohnia sp. SAFN-114]|uniref:hypothetical protein n=1 Tax=Ferdinandcohnia sp. SAFN-114 TaxID=3387275 RepID=UPI003F7D0440
LNFFMKATKRKRGRKICVYFLDIVSYTLSDFNRCSSLDFQKHHVLFFTGKIQRMELQVSYKESKK